MGDLVHAGDGAVELADALALLVRGLGDLADAFVKLARLLHDGCEVRGHLFADPHALLALFGGGGNLLRRLLGGTGAALGEVAHLVGDDREAQAGLAGAGGFHRGVEGEDVGLEGDLIDRLDNLGNFDAGALDGAHGGLHLLHVRRAGIGRLACLVGEALGVLGIL